MSRTSKVCFLSSYSDTFFDIEAQLCTEMMTFIISMDMSCEGFVKGFRLRYSPL